MKDEMINLFIEIENLSSEEFDQFCFMLLHQKPKKSEEDTLHKFVAIARRFRNEFV